MKKVETLFKYPTRYKKGEIIIRPEEEIDNIFYIKRGMVRMFAVSSDGEEIITHIFKKGSYFPIILSLSETPNHFYFKVVKDTTLTKAKPKKVIDYLKKNPESTYELSKRLSRGMNGLITRLEETLSLSAKKRLISLLIYLSQNFGKKTNKGKTITLRLTHQEISSWLGLSRETVSRLMKVLEKERLISYSRRKIVVLDRLK